MKYYKSTGFRGYLFIGDSSEGECLEKNKETIKNYNSFLQINYCEFPDLMTGHVSAKLVPQIETEFSTFLSDVHIIITSSIDSCINLSDSLSRALVASSKINKSGFLNNALAKAILCL